jgi:hypothetical protein
MRWGKAVLWIRFGRRRDRQRGRQGDEGRRRETTDKETGRQGDSGREEIRRQGEIRTGGKEEKEIQDERIIKSGRL